MIFEFCYNRLAIVNPQKALRNLDFLGHLHTKARETKISKTKFAVIDKLKLVNLKVYMTRKFFLRFLIVLCV